MIRSVAVAAALFAIAHVQPAAAEATTLRAAKQFGLGYVQFMIMEDLKLVEKHAKAAGLGEIKVEWSTFRSSDVMNDALLSGNVDFVSLGVPGLMTIWDRTKGTIDVKGVTALELHSAGAQCAQSRRQEPQGLRREGPHRRAGGEGVDAGHPAADGAARRSSGRATTASSTIS